MAVPCHGLQSGKVYAFAAASLLAAAALSLPAQKRQSSPAAAESPKDGDAAPAALPKSAGRSSSRNPREQAVYENAKRIFPELVSGPCSVAKAKAEPPGKGIWAPSKDFQFLDSDSFYANRARGHLRAGIGQRRRLGENQGAQVKGLGYAADFEPFQRDGVEMLPVHLAAEDGSVWWLERCGATQTCRAMLVEPDTAGDTPLHHSARVGCRPSCLALLRMGGDPQARNDEELLPEELAVQAGHPELAQLLRAARQAEGPAGDMLLHPDGLGVLAEPPEGVVYVGLKESEPLRRSVNMAAGFRITPPLPIPRHLQEGGDDTVEHIVDTVRGSIQDTEFMLEDMVDNANPLPFDGEDAQLRHCGLLFYESPGSVSPDSPGHWFAVRRSQTGAPDEVEGGECWRLDPIRGPYRLRQGELQELLKRYRSWCLVQGPEHLREERTRKLAKAKDEAYELLVKRSGTTLVNILRPELK